MVDPVSVLSLLVTTFQFGLSLKTYSSERKRRKQQALQRALQDYHHDLPLISTPAATTTTTPTPTIPCTYNDCIFPAQPASSYYHHHGQSAHSSPHAANYFHLPNAQLPITSSPPALSHQNSAPGASMASPSALNLYPPLAQPITLALSRFGSAPASLSSPHAPNFYPPLAQPITNSPDLPASRHHNSTLASASILSRSLDLISPFDTHLPASTSINRAATVSYSWSNFLYGCMEVHTPRAPGSLIGLRTTACSHNKRDSCLDHWRSLQEESSQGSISQGSIAVVDWNRSNIEMFVEVQGVYSRNYRISRCDVTMFAQLFKTREVFSGEIKGQKLERFNRPMEMVELAGMRVLSTNSWRSLGVDDESEDLQEVLSEGSLFLKMQRGAVFGLVCSLYEAPSRLDVEMERSIPGRTGSSLDIVRITTPPWHIDKRDACIFSVFAFCDRGWASEDVLLG